MSWGYAGICLQYNTMLVMKSTCQTRISQVNGEVLWHLGYRLSLPGSHKKWHNTNEVPYAQRRKIIQLRYAEIPTHARPQKMEGRERPNR